MQYQRGYIIQVFSEKVFGQIVKFKPFSSFVKSVILDVWLICESTSAQIPTNVFEVGMERYFIAIFGGYLLFLWGSSNFCKIASINLTNLLQIFVNHELIQGGFWL